MSHVARQSALVLAALAAICCGGGASTTGDGTAIPQEATGGSSNGTGGASAGSSGKGTAATSGGGSGGASGASPSGGASATGGASGDGCDPLSPTTCSGATSKCGYDSATGAFACEAPGTGGDQAACTYDEMGHDDCAAGFACVLQPGVCSKICDATKTSADCPAGQLCNGLVTGQNGTSFHVCQAKPPPCDPLAQNCTMAGTACYPTSVDPECAPEGTAAVTQACTYANDCVKGDVCLMDGGTRRCYAMCSPTGGTPTCTGGKTCVDIGNPTYGACK